MDALLRQGDVDSARYCSVNLNIIRPLIADLVAAKMEVPANFQRMRFLKAAIEQAVENIPMDALGIRAQSGGGGDGDDNGQGSGGGGGGGDGSGSGGIQRTGSNADTSESFDSERMQVRNRSAIFRLRLTHLRLNFRLTAMPGAAHGSG
jgi:hypothetical protein